MVVIRPTWFFVCMSSVTPAITEFVMTGELTPIIAGATGLVVGGIAFVIALWYERRKLTTKSVPPTETSYFPLIERTLPDRIVVWGNPGHHAAVTRLILNGRTVEAIDSLFDNYINSVSHHKAYEIDVVTVHYLKKLQLLDGDERLRWFGNERLDIIQKYGYPRDRFIKAMSDVWEKYPELDDRESRL